MKVKIYKEAGVLVEVRQKEKHSGEMRLEYINVFHCEYLFLIFIYMKFTQELSNNSSNPSTQREKNN